MDHKAKARQRRRSKALRKLEAAQKPKRVRINAAVMHDIHDAVHNKTPTVRATKRQMDVWQREISSSLSTPDLGLFLSLDFNFRKNPTALNYLKLRQQFPAIDPGVAVGFDRWDIMVDELQEEGINWKLFNEAMCCDEDSVDALCLQILQRIAERESLPKSGPGYLTKQQAAIKNSTVNFLITLMMEWIEWHDRPIQMPSSLFFLIRYQFFGTATPDLAEVAYRKSKQRDLALHVGARLPDHDGKLPSINELTEISGLPRNTAARWLKDRHFMFWANFAARATEEFDRHFPEDKASRLKDVQARAPRRPL